MLIWTQLLDKHAPLKSTKLPRHDVHFGCPSAGQSSPVAAKPAVHIQLRGGEDDEEDTKVTGITVLAVLVVAGC